MAVTSLSERFKLHAMAWLFNLLGIALFILTIMYACGSYSMAGFKRVRSSSSNTILVLRVLSELSSILLTINLGLTLENIKWRLVTRFRGQELPAFLGLVPGTTVFGLIQLVFSKGSAWSSWRFWSLGRLVLLALLPVLNIIIFSDITTQLGYHVETTMTGPYSGAMGDFNASKAAVYGPMIDSFFGPEFADFLSDSRRVIDITSNAKDAVPCSSGFSKTSTQTCDQTFFMPALVADVNILRNAAVPQANMIVLHNSPGWMLNFTANNQPTGFDSTVDCRVYGTYLAAFEICAIGKNGSLELRLNACVNTQDLEDSDCLADLNWPEPLVPSIKAQISVRNATVGFSRLNTTIQTYQLANSWSMPDIHGSDVLKAFDGFFDTPKNELVDLSQLVDPFVGPTKIKYAPVFIVSTIATINLLYGANAAIARNTNALQALLAAALQYCSGLYGDTIPSAEALSADGNTNITAVLEEAFSKLPRASYSLASTSYHLVVGSTTIWVYAVLGALFLLMNLVVTCLCTFTDSEQRRPPTTPFADIDHRRLRIDVPMPALGNRPRWDDADRVGLIPGANDERDWLQED